MFSAKPKHFLTALLFSLLVQVVSVTPAVAASAVYDCLFNWAESAYANLFAPRGATSTSFGPAYYRYYAQTNSYIGVSLTNSHLYYIGVLSANSLLDVGAVSAWYTQAGCSNVPPIATAPPTTLSAADLQGTWVVTWDSGNNPLPEIVITATGQNTFTGTYNPPYAGRIEGTINGSTITVRQLYNDGRLYGTYTFNNNSSSSLRGSLVDYLTSYNNVEWTKR